MNRRVIQLVLVALVAAMLAFGGLAAAGAARTPHATAMSLPAARFQWVDVYVTTDEWSLGAWQAEVKVASGTAKLAGVEGGEGAFAEAPVYDAAALQSGRIIVGAVTTAAGTPSRVRVARLHLMVEGDVATRFEASLMASADGGATRREGKIELVPGSAGADELK